MTRLVTMKRLLLAAVAVAALASPASARDYWNGSGFSLDHNFHSPYDNMFRGGGDYGGYFTAPGGPRTIHVPSDFDMGNRDSVEVPDLGSARLLRKLDAARTAKAIRDERICAPVILYTDDGIIRHRALGCIR